jgi:quinol monooxygenase YgiN
VSTFEPPQIVVAGTITVDIEANPDARTNCLTASAKWQELTRVEEPGCLAYVFTADPIDPAVIQVYERWTDADALLAHFDHRNYHEMRAVLGAAGLKAVQVERLRVDAARPIYDADRVARPHEWD